MKVLLLNNNKIESFRLPIRVDGSLWITDVDQTGNEKKIINIEAGKDNEWYLISNSDYYIMDKNNNRVKSLKIEKNNLYTIKNSYSVDAKYIYIMQNEDRFDYYSMKSYLDVGINIGSDSSCKVCYKFPMVSVSHAKIIYKDNEVYLIPNDALYLNNKKVKIETKLSFGDTIFIYGLRMILIRTQNDIIFGINNPNDLVKVSLEKADYAINSSLENFDEATEEKEIELYTVDDYFYRKPRFIYSIEPLEINVDSPPAKREDTKLPAILTIGPMITMSFTSMLTIYNNIYNMSQNGRTLKESLPSLIAGGAMLLSLLFWPSLTKMFEKKYNKKEEDERQKKYTDYIESQRKLILNEKTAQENIIRNSYLNLTECANIINERKDRLWEKRVEDDDYLEVSLGYGNSNMKINLIYPEQHFSMVEDNLIEKANELNKSPKILENVPITYSIRQNFISAVIGKSELYYKLINNIILQLVTFHSYDNLKIVILTSKGNDYNFEDMKLLPHCFSNDRSIRYFATNMDEYKEVFYNLEKTYQAYKENSSTSSNTSTTYNQNYFIVTDSFDALRNYDFVKQLIEKKEYLGFSLMILNDNISNLPDQCQTFIELNDINSKIFKNISNSEEILFNIDKTEINYFNCFRKLANIPINLNIDNEGIIPKKVGFLEMFEVGKVEQLNCKNRWLNNTPIQNMAALVGLGKSGEKIFLDIHEKYHGPHGLIAGMTGSGKSEFIITYILSLALNYHPYEVQFILIDYKGGSLTGAFENSTLGYKLPHLVGAITNLDKSEINRSLVSIESELKRRQTLFNNARDISGDSTIDIYKYQEMYRNHKVKEPISHLLIIADEFAELKTQQPEFMEQLISTARIGRSLGVHLILATQKPSGIVDSQIWSNTRFRVCMRVQEKSDSTEVIQCPDAAYLTQTGRFYLQVGYNEIFILGQSAWSGGKYIPSDNIKKNIDSSVNFINNVGYVIKSIETKKNEVVTENRGEELINIVKYLCDCAESEKIVTTPLWLERIPNNIYVGNLIRKYKYTKENYILNPIIGEYDVPNMQQQHLLTIPFTKEGNALVYGISGSGKENFITTMIYSSLAYYSPDELNYYIIDCGSEVLKYFENSPIVGDVLYVSDEEKIKNLFKMVTDEIDKRKKMFSNYNGNYAQYCANNGNVVPNIVIVINNYEAFIETYNDYEDNLVVLTRDCTKYGIYFLFTVISPNGVRFRIKQNFSQLFVLQQNSEDDYSAILGNVNKTYPSKMFGRGIIKMDMTYEFQTALVSEVDKVSKSINDLNDKLNSRYKNKAKKIPSLPDIVVYDDIKEELNINDIIVGIDKDSLETVTYNLNKNAINLLTGLDYNSMYKYINIMLNQLTSKPNLVNIIINAEEVEIENSIKEKANYYDKNYDKVFNALLEMLEAINKFYVQKANDKTAINKKYNCIIIGLNSFKNKLSHDNNSNFDKLFSIAKNTEAINYVFVDTIDKIKTYEYENWFKLNINKGDYIWFGSGIKDQFILNLNTKLSEASLVDVPNNFCFVVKNSRCQYVKYIEKMSSDIE